MAIGGQIYFHVLGTHTPTAQLPTNSRFFFLLAPQFLCQHNLRSSPVVSNNRHCLSLQKRIDVSVQKESVQDYVIRRTLKVHPKTLFEIAMVLSTNSSSFPSNSHVSATFSILLRFGESWNPTNCEKFNADGSLMARTNLDKSVW